MVQVKKQLIIQVKDFVNQNIPYPFKSPEKKRLNGLYPNVNRDQQQVRNKKIHRP